MLHNIITSYIKIYKDKEKTKNEKDCFNYSIITIYNITYVM